MSSSRPPQLQIPLPAETGTSFKRSFEQYGFDLDTPLDGSGEASGSSGTTSLGSGNGNERNKRARSSSSSSTSESTTAGSSGSFEVEMLVGGGSGSSSVSTSLEDDSMAGTSANRPISLSSDGEILNLPSPSTFAVPRPLQSIDNTTVFPSQPALRSRTPSNVAAARAMGRTLQSPPVPEVFTSSNTQMLHPSSRVPLSIRPSAFPTSSSQPPRIPTPSPLDEDLQMDILDTQSASTSDSSDNYRVSLERFNMFDSEISAIRHHPHNPTHSPTFRSPSPTSPLFPDISEDAPRLAQSVPGLRVFTMGSIRSSEQRNNNQQSPFSSRPVLDMYETETSSSSSPQVETSTATRRLNLTEPPASLLPMPHTTASPLLSRDDLEWWTNHLSTDDAPTSRRSPSQFRPTPNSLSTALLSNQDLPIAEPSRRPTSTYRPMIEDDSSDEEFPSIGQRRPGSLRQTLRPPAAQADWTHGGSSSARERAMRIIAERRAAASSARAPSSPRRPASSASFGLPTIETSDFELPSEFEGRSRFASRSQALTNTPSTLEPTPSSGIPGDGTRSPDRVWGRRWPLGAPASRLNESLSLSNRGEITNPSNGSTSSIDSAPSSQIRQRSYSSRVGASNSLMSENASELRRRTERSRMLESLASETSLDAESPWLPTRTLPRRDSETPSSRPFSYIASGERQNPVVARRQSYASPQHRQVGLHYRSAPAPTIFNPSPLEAATPTIRGPSNSVAHMSRDAVSSNGPHYLYRPEPDVPTSSDSFGSGTTRRERPGHDYLSAIDARHRRPSVRAPPRPRSPLLWDDAMHLPELDGHDPTPPQAPDLDLEARARRRSLMNLYNSSPSPTSIPDTSTPITTEQPAPSSNSAYGNLDLSAFQQGPILDSIQRYVDYDNIRARLSRLEAQAELASPSTVASPRARSPPSIPPLQFDSDDDFSRPYFTFRRQTELRREETFTSSVTDPDRGFPHLYREARNGRVPVLPSPDERRSEQTNDARSRLGLSREVSSPWRTSMGSRAAALAHNQSREHLFGTTGRGPAPIRTSANESSHPPQSTSHSRPSLRPPSILFPRTSQHASPEMTSNAQSHSDARAGTGASLLGDYFTSLDHPETRDADGFGEAMDILGADGMRPQTQRQFEDRWQQVNRPSSVENTGARSRASYLSSAGRYTRRGAFGLPPQAGDLAARGNLASSGPTTRRHSLSSQSPIRSDSSPERLATTAANLNNRASRLRATRDRALRDREFAMGDFPRFGFVPYHRHARNNMGDYMRDEDFDPSYENLITLASTLGEVRPKATPSHVISSLSTGLYKDWQKPESDTRCPICLEDYEAMDQVTQLSNCSHWLHKDCLEQWLHGASTCPVCRENVKGPSRPSRCPYQQQNTGQTPVPSGSGSGHRADDDDDDDDELWQAAPPWRLFE